MSKEQAPHNAVQIGAPEDVTLPYVSPAASIDASRIIYVNSDYLCYI